MPYFTELASFTERTRLERILLDWAGSFDTYCLLNSNGFVTSWADGSSLACGVRDEVCCSAELLPAASYAGLASDSSGPAGLPSPSLTALDTFRRKSGGRIYGFLSYDLKNELEPLQSPAGQLSGFPLLYFFLPEYLLHIRPGILVLETEKAPDVLPFKIRELLALLGQNLQESGPTPELNQPAPAVHTSAPAVLALPPEIQARESLDTYLHKAGEIKAQIQAGNIYELNFCQEFFINSLQVRPEALYEQLNKASPAPFSLLFKFRNAYILSSSMERFLTRTGTKLISQPIKGTIRRSTDPEQDKLLAESLRLNEKERAENIMIVDLVRNDLSKIALPGSVTVEELARIYSFAQVHQMISTISAESTSDLSMTALLTALFPMGSMTGAPKLRAMQLIDQFEAVPRGVYSGSAGYIDSNGDFDFNVLIRTMLYDGDRQYLSFHTGSALTSLADLHEEYAECLLKAAGILKALEHTI